ncbi:MAG TPA: phosphodiester glycosidase family protein [Candidatus Saccharimonadales bacterium]|nr:phosphodiester glycosidase family protein [Candidatus Saccharimonadales bacterium]
MIKDSETAIAREPYLIGELTHGFDTPMIAAATVPETPIVKKTHKLRRKIVFGVGAFMVAAAAAVGYAHDNHDQAAEFSRSIIGDEATAVLQKYGLQVEDKIDQLKFKVFGGRTNPFANTQEAKAPIWYQPLIYEGDVPTDYVAPPPEPPKPAPLFLPETRPARPDPENHEGVWTTAGLPLSSEEDKLMVKTYIRPDTARSYASVGVLLMDKRRIRLHIVGGTDHPGGDLGIKGPGVIPEEDKQNLIVAWNGGFQGPHGGFGMVADGKQYRPLRNGYASIAVTRDGEILMGEWGRTIFWRNDVEAVRQNAVLLVEDCQISKRTNEGNNTWGYVQVNSAEFITWRSAVGLTEKGDLIYAAGNSLSAATLAKALWAAGACTAMQLDINSPYVLGSLFFPTEGAPLGRAKFMDSMPDNPARFLNKQSRDFMYVDLDETNFKPKS